MAVTAYPESNTPGDAPDATAETVERLETLARRVRALVIRMVAGSSGGHPFGRSSRRAARSTSG